MVAAFWLVSFVNLGFTTYGSGILNTAMAEALGFDARQLGLFFSIFPLMLGLPSPLVGLVIAHFGLRAAIVTGSIMVVAAATAMATVVKTAPAAAVAFGLVMGAGVAFSGVMPGQVGVGRWFVRRRGRFRSRCRPTVSAAWCPRRYSIMPRRPVAGVVGGRSSRC